MADSSDVRARLAAAGLDLGEPPAAVGLYLPARRTAGVVTTSGQLPIADGSLITSGTVGREVDETTARGCAARCALNALAAATTVCDLDDVDAVVQLVGYVASAPDFTAQPAVVDGASEVLLTAFGGEVGGHARVAVGVASLPLGAPVEVSVVLSLAG